LRFTFGDYSLDVDRRELKRGADPVAVEPQVFDLLVHLLRNRDRVVGKDELLDAVWGRRAVSESTLTSRIKAARTAIGDDGEAQRLIKTLARRGFRFIGTVAAAPPAEARIEPGGAREPGGIEHRPAFALPDKPSIVVLPFANLGGDQGQEYFTDGMVEDITVALARLPQLFVIGSASAFAYKNRTVDARQVGAELGVRYVLQGSVRKDAKHLRITAQLVDASHGGHIWADRFEGELESLFDMQDRVASYVSSMIAPALRTAEVERSTRKPTENLTAYDLFLRASPWLRLFDPAQNRESLRLLYRAIELDPSYGAAYGLAALCICWRHVFNWITRSDPQVAEGVRLARAALECGDNDSEALWTAAHALMILDGDLEQALAAVDRALSLNPNSPNAWWVSGVIHAFRQETETALEHLAKARRLNPFERAYHSYWQGTALEHVLAGRFDDAALAVDKSLAENGRFPPALRIKIVTCGQLGRVEEGREYVKRLLAVSPGASVAATRALFGKLVERNPRGFERYFEGLRRCGLREDETS
jgi:TolB-like protein